MTIPEIVKKYIIRVNPNKSLCVRREILKHEDDKVYIMEHRDEIIAYIEEQKAIEEQKHLERLKKINAIEGLQELEDASIAWKKYYSDYRHFIEDGAEGKAPKKPEASLEELVRKYPRANAYMKAEGYAYSSSNDVRASAGKKALERILNGEDYEQAIADMKKEWHDYCEEHVFDN